MTRRYHLRANKAREATPAHFQRGVVSCCPEWVVPRAKLVEANGALATVDSGAAIAGPALGGILVQLVTAPVAVAADACSFVASALLVGSVPASGAVVADGQPRRSVWHEIAEGLAWVVRHPVLRPLALCSGAFNLCSGMYVAGYVLYAARDLELSPAAIGLIDAVRGPGFLVGAAVVAFVTRRLGFGTTVLLGGYMMGIGILAAPLLGAGSALLVPALVVGFFVNGLGNPLYNVNASTLRQVVTPDRLLGRMQAAWRFIGRGGLPVGAILGGVIGEAYGVRAALLLASLGMLVAPVWLLLSPVRALRDPNAPRV